MKVADTPIAPRIFPATGGDVEQPAGVLPVLVFAPRGRDGGLVASALQSAAVPCEVCVDTSPFSDGVEHIGALVLTVEALTPRNLALLNTVLDAQPPWSSLPVIILLRPHPSGLQDDAKDEALKIGRHTIVLELPVSPATLVSAVRSGLESRRRQYEVRDLQAGLEDTVARRTARLRSTALELTRAEHEERRRLAHLLHDHFQQLLVAAKMNLSLFNFRADDLANREVAETVNDLLVQTITASRSLATNLSPPVLGRDGLSKALRWLGDEMLTRHKLNVVVKAEEGLKASDPEAAAFLFDATRELLFNIVKHAGVDEASVELTRDGGNIRLAIEDHGPGMPKTSGDADSSGSGFGLSSIRERIESIGGRMEIGFPGADPRTPGLTGCKITICIPAMSKPW